jgi:hypothetical protein
MKREFKCIFRVLQQAGFKVNPTKNGHVRIDAPQGPVFASSTPSDHRAVKNLVSMLRRKGIPAEVLMSF